LKRDNTAGREAHDVSTLEACVPEYIQRIGGFLLEAQLPGIQGAASVPAPVEEHAPVRLQSHRVHDGHQRILVERAMDEEDRVPVASNVVLKLASRLHRTILACGSARGDRKG
jgi:hypothetical protein